MLDNYRGIAVGSALGKVLSLVVHARLFAWSEEQALQAAVQQVKPGLGMVTASVIMCLCLSIWSTNADRHEAHGSTV